MTQPKKDEVQMAAPAPYVSPGVSPAAAQYAKAAQQRRSDAAAAALPKYDTPVAGGVTPPIPLLNQPHVDGRTMADAAVMQRGIGHGGPPSIIEGAPTPAAAAAPFLLPQDLLPEEATQDPEFLQGMGSRYATAQPHLAMKYGVIRSGHRVPPQQLTAAPGAPPQQGRLRPETVEGLKKLQSLGDSPPQGPEPPEADKEIAEAHSHDSPAGAATRIGGGAAAPNRKLDEEARKTLDNLDDFDLDSLHNMMVRDLFNNEEQRKIIESRCEPMNLADLVMTGVVKQRVPIVLPTEDSKGFVPVFQSLGGDDDLACKRLIVAEATALKVDDRYLLDKYAFMGLTCALDSINGTPLPTHRDKDGNFNDDLFWTKFNKVIRFPLPMLASLGVNYFWFDVRVRRLFVAEKVKNG